VTLEIVRLDDLWFPRDDTVCELRQDGPIKEKSLAQQIHWKAGCLCRTQEVVRAEGTTSSTDSGHRGVQYSDAAFAGNLYISCEHQQRLHRSSDRFGFNQ
jgi:hypothetical protein